jgi:hypothetical protein
MLLRFIVDQGFTFFSIFGISEGAGYLLRFIQGRAGPTPHQKFAQ